MMERNRVFYCDTRGETDSIEPERSVLFSVGTSFQPRSQYYTYFIDLYGEGIDNLRNHLTVHMENILETSTEANIVIYISPSIPVEKLDQAFRSFKYRRHGWISTKQMVYEKDF